MQQIPAYIVMPMLAARGRCPLSGASRAGDSDGVRGTQESGADEPLRDGAAAAAVARL